MPLSTETEIKISVSSIENFIEKLRGHNPRVVADRHFEDNRLLDFPDKRLQNAGCIVRIRYAGERSFLTYKGPPEAEGIFKSREELETKLEDGDTALQILEKLGMRVWFRYQKYRREYEVDSVIVAVDETPIGNYVEIEGSEKCICDFAGKMGIEESKFLRQSYYSLYLDECRFKGKKPGDMILEQT
jgi:adenylate cyclase class 2